jgi:undecaprenyl-diphosphatase
LVLLLLVVVVAAIVLYARWIKNNPEKIRALVERQLDRPAMSRLRNRYETQLEFLSRRLRPEGALGLSLTVGIVLIGATGWLFGALVQDVVARDDLALVDMPVEHFFLIHRELWLNTAMRTVTWFGSTAVLIPLALISGGFWWWKTGSRRPLALLLGAYFGAAALSDVVKPLVARPPPPVNQMVATFGGWSFPSGHASQSIAVYGMLAVLLASTTSSWTTKVTLWSMALTITLVVGISRIYLGVHWLTDVLGGYALGALWLFTLVTVVRSIDRARGSRQTGVSPVAPRAAPFRP